MMKSFASSVCSVRAPCVALGRKARVGKDGLSPRISGGMVWHRILVDRPRGEKVDFRGWKTGFDIVRMQGQGVADCKIGSRPIED